MKQIKTDPLRKDSSTIGQIDRDSVYGRHANNPVAINNIHKRVYLEPLENQRRNSQNGHH